MIYLLGSITSIIRLIPNYVSRYAGYAGWIAPIYSGILLLGIVWVIQKIYKQYPTQSFDEILTDIFGKALSRIILSLYAIWLFLTCSTYLRYYTERFQGSIIKYTTTEVLLIAMLILIAIGFWYGIKSIGRLAELTYPITVFFMLLIVILSIPRMRVENFLPISYLDLIPTMKGSLASSASMGYLIMIFFLADQLKKKDEFGKRGGKAVLFQTIFTTVITFSSIAVNGSSVCTRVSIPFYVLAKQLKVFGVLERFEPILVVVWMISDFVLISVMLYIVMKILGCLLHLKSTKFLSVPILILLYYLSVYLSDSKFELESVFESIGMPVIFVFAYLMPVLALLIGKLRKKIQ